MIALCNGERSSKKGKMGKVKNEYFLKEKERKLKKLQERKEKQAAANVQREEKRRKAYKPPKESPSSSIGNNYNVKSVDVDSLKTKIKKASLSSKKTMK